MSEATSPRGKRVSFYTEANQALCESLFAVEDEALQRARARADEMGLPPISISPNDGQTLRLLLSLVRVERAVEIGTLAGYSAIWIARSMVAGGRLDCFELDAERAQLARENVAHAKPDVAVTVHEGKALEQLHRVKGTVDFVFIDADKEGYPAYLDWAAENVRAGGLVALDNAFAWGALSEPTLLGGRARDGEAMRAAVEALARDPRWRVKGMIPTNEGLAVAIRA